MNKPRVTIIVLIIVCLVLLTSSVLAGQFANYRLDWFTPLTSGGGGPSSSANYAADITIGQTASKVSTGGLYTVSLGYWAGIWLGTYIHLPIITNNAK